MSAVMRLDGLLELKEALQHLTPELQAESQAIVYANADKAAEEIRAAYPRRTGNLKDHVYVSKRGSTISTTATVKNTAHHAWLFENGSQARHTDLGANRGSMPPGHVFIPIMIRRRRIMYQILKDLVASKGLTVSGDAAA